MELIEAKANRIINVKLSQGEDLILSIKEAAKKVELQSGAFFALGTLQKVHMSFYKPEPTPITIEEPLEIVSCVGKIESKEQGVTVHGHICVSNSRLHCFGGHLLEGCIIDALGDVTILEFADINL